MIRFAKLTLAGANSPLTEQPGAVEFGPFRFEPAERRLLRDGRDVPLPPKAVELLAVLLARSGRLVTRDTLLKEIWPDTFVEEANLTYTISVLRKALGDESSARYIDTFQKRGYRFIGEIRTLPSSAAPSETPSAVPERATEASVAATGSVRPAAPDRRTGWTRRTWYLGFALSVLLVTGAASMLTRNWSSRVVAPPPRARFDMPVPDGIELTAFGGATISPDGRQIVFTARVNGKWQLLLRSLDSAVPIPLPGTERASTPFWSPDSRTIGFFADDKLKKIDVAGGQPVITLCSGSGSGAWRADGVIVFSNGPLYRIPAAGGTPEVVTTLDTSRGETNHIVAGFLSDGRLIFSDNLRRAASYYVVSLSSPSERHKLDLTGSPQGGVTLFTSNGRLFYNKRGTITVQTLDENTLQMGPELTLADGWSLPTASRTGTVVFRTSAYPTTQLTWVDRTGRRLSTVGAPDTYTAVELSPTGTRAAVVRGGPWIYDADLWLADLATGVFTPLTNHQGLKADPAWSPDEQRIVYSSDQAGHLLPFVKDMATGREERLVDASNGNGFFVDDWTTDGQFVIVRSNQSVLAISVSGEPKMTRLNSSPIRMDQSQVSPDGHWIAFQSVAPDSVNVYVAEFPSFTGVRQVSIARGSQPRLRRDGKELFYIDDDMAMMSVAVGNGTFATPRPLFKVSRPNADGSSQYDVTADGQRFLIVEPRQPPRDMFTFLLNWIPAESR